MNYIKNTIPAEASGVDNSAEQALEHKENLEKITSLLDQPYQFDVASFEAKTVPKFTNAFESEIVTVNPLMLLKSGFKLDMGGQRFLSACSEGGISKILLETPVLSLDTEQLVVKNDGVMDSSIVEAEFSMNLNEFFHRLRDAQGVSFVAKARLAGVDDFFEMLPLVQEVIQH